MRRWKRSPMSSRSIYHRVKSRFQGISSGSFRVARHPPKARRRASLPFGDNTAGCCVSLVVGQTILARSSELFNRSVLLNHSRL